MVMNSAFRIHAMMAAGVAFHTHHVVAVFQTKKARNESQNNRPFSPCAMRSSNNSSGTKPMKAKAATPQVGQAAVSNPPLINANSILRPRPSRVSCPEVPRLFWGRGNLFLVLFMPNFPKFLQRYSFLTYICAKILQMKKTYEVAGHKFAILMPDDSSLWQLMHNYDPFEVEDGEGCVFTAELVNEWYDTNDKKKLITAGTKRDKMRIDIYEWNGKYLLEIAPTLDEPVRLYMLVDKGYSHVEFYESESAEYSINPVLMLTYAMATATKDTALIHASVMMKDGKGYLFLGRSGTGKSTHSQLWIKNIDGCELLNDDNPVLRVDADGTVRVYGSPWSGKTPCYRNLVVPAGAFVDLHQAKKNDIKRQTMVEAYASLMVSITAFRFFSDLTDGYHASLVKFISAVPCYSLDCLPNAEAAFLCYKTVSQQ